MDVPHHALKDVLATIPNLLQVRRQCLIVTDYAVCCGITLGDSTLGLSLLTASVVLTAVV